MVKIFIFLFLLAGFCLGVVACVNQKLWDRAHDDCKCECGFSHV